MSGRVHPIQAARVRQKIANDSAFAVHALRVIYERCTEREKLAGRDLGERDGRGFTPVEIDSMIELHERLEARGFRATPHQLDRLRKAMQKYAVQLVIASREEREVVYTRAAG